MKHLLLACTSVCLLVLLACSKPDDLPPQPNNILTPPPPAVPATIKIDTIISYTPVYTPWLGSQKLFSFPALDGISNPVIDVYYKTTTQTTWKKLPDGYTAWFIRNGKSIVVYVRMTTTEISVNIKAAW